MIIILDNKTYSLVPKSYGGVSVENSPSRKYSRYGKTYSTGIMFKLVGNYQYFKNIFKSNNSFYVDAKTPFEFNTSQVLCVRELSKTKENSIVLIKLIGSENKIDQNTITKIKRISALSEIL